MSVVRWRLGRTWDPGWQKRGCRSALGLGAGSGFTIITKSELRRGNIKRGEGRGVRAAIGQDRMG